MKNKKIAALCSLGCKVNSYETESMTSALKEAGYEIVPFGSKADVYIINTCSVTSVSDKKSRQMIRRAKRLNPDCIVVACGCYVEKDADKIRDDCDIIIGNNKKSVLVEEIENHIKSGEKSEIKDNLFSKDTVYEKLVHDETGEKTRAFIKVQDGCNAYCTYCIIPFLRGKSRSRDYDDIINEARLLSQKGHKEIVLSGINLSDYHKDGKGLAELIIGINDISKVERIRLGSLEPNIFTKEFVSSVKDAKKLCPHFHFSLQSACDKTLKNMKRRYVTKESIEAASFIKESFLDVAICADVIAGFPGETKEDFNETIENIKKMGMYELHVFPYSEREGTVAAKMENRLSKAVKEERAKRLLELSKDLKTNFQKEFLGRTADVLFEEKTEIDGRVFWLGFTSNYIRCACPDLSIKRGEILTVSVEKMLSPDLLEVSLLL